jgi:hypothetical protein
LVSRGFKADLESVLIEGLLIFTGKSGYDKVVGNPTRIFTAHFRFILSGSISKFVFSFLQASIPFNPFSGKLYSSEKAYFLKKHITD